MEATNEFALRCENWVIWNMGGWNGGWIDLRLTTTKSTPGVGRPTLRLGWNGTRFAQSKEGVRLQKIDPDAEQILAGYLAIVLPCPMVTA